MVEEEMTDENGNTVKIKTSTKTLADGTVLTVTERIGKDGKKIVIE